MKNQLVFIVGSILILMISISFVDSLNRENSDRQCECLNDDCGCCEYLKWTEVGLNGTLCANITYLRDDYGMAVTIIYNTYTLFNETVSARNPPPFCFGIPDLEKIQAHVCVRLYDLTWGNKYFHGCSSVSISVYHVIHKSIKLGCFNIPKESFHDGAMDFLHLVREAVKDKLEYLESLNKVEPVVVMI